MAQNPDIELLFQAIRATELSPSQCLFFVEVYFVGFVKHGSHNSNSMKWSALKHAYEQNHTVVKTDKLGDQKHMCALASVRA